jgi:hypothetical protein
MAKQGIFLDSVNPSDFLNLNMTYCCEQCSHFDPEKEQCTIGYNAANHRRERQLQTFETSGRMAFCRMMEID